MSEQRLQDAGGEAIEDAGGFLLPHVRTFAAIWNTFTRTYRYTWDEAIKHSPTNALTMRRDAFVMGCLQERYLQVAQLPWHLDAMHSLTAQVLNAAQNAAAHNPTLSSALADANNEDESVAAGGLTNLLNWIVANWSQIAAIITQVLTWFGIKA